MAVTHTSNITVLRRYLAVILTRRSRTRRGKFAERYVRETQSQDGGWTLTSYWRDHYNPCRGYFGFTVCG